jgi:hypothetical protein
MVFGRGGTFGSRVTFFRKEIFCLTKGTGRRRPLSPKIEDENERDNEGDFGRVLQPPAAEAMPSNSVKVCGDSVN